MPELPLSDSGKGGGETGNFGGFKYWLSYHNFSNADLIILGILQRLLSVSQRGRAVIFYFERDCETPVSQRSPNPFSSLPRGKNVPFSC